MDPSHPGAPFTIELLRQLISGTQDGTDDSSDDDPEEFGEYIRGGHQPAACSNLLHTPLHEKILASTSAGPGTPNVSIFQMAQQVGNPCLPRSPGFHGPRASFLSHSQTHITQRLVPNSGSVLDSYHQPTFSGTFSSNGEMLMTACKDAHLRIYDTNSWKNIKTIAAKDVGWSIISTDYSPDQQWAIYSSWSPFVHMCNTSGREIHEALDMKVPNHRSFCLFSIQFSQDSREIIGGSNGGHIYIYDLERKERTTKVFGHQEDVNTVTFADKSCQTVFSGSDDYLIKIWDRRTMGSTGCVGILKGHTRGITYIDSKQDGIHFISNGKDHTCKLWDIRKMTNSRSIRGAPSDLSLMTFRGHQVARTLIRCRFSPKESTGNRYVYSGSYTGSVFIWDTITGALVKKLKGHDSIVRDAHWHPTKPEIISSGWDALVKKWTWDEDTENWETRMRCEYSGASTTGARQGKK